MGEAGYTVDRSLACRRANTQKLTIQSHIHTSGQFRTTN